MLLDALNGIGVDVVLLEDEWTLIYSTYTAF